MAELVLSFTPPPGAELTATSFSHRRLNGDVKAQLGAYGQSFRWTSGVQSLTVLLLRTAAWSRSGGHADPEPPRLEGKRPSLASSLNDALTAKPQWTADVFGTANGRPMLESLIDRRNADFNSSPGGPVTLWLDREELDPGKITVLVDGRPLEDPCRIDALASDIHRQWERGKAGRARPPLASGAEQGGGVGVKVEVRTRSVVTVEIELDRDFDTFSPEEEERLLRAIQAQLRASGEIRLRGKRRGSVILTFELSPEEAEELVAAVKAGALSAYRATGARVIPEDALPTGHVGERPIHEMKQGGGVKSEDALQTVLLHDCVDRWQAGDAAAADRLFDAIGRRLENMARRMLRGYPNVRDFADTDDVYHGAILRLLHTLRKLRPATTRDFFNLAAAHVRRELLDLARRHAKNPRPGRGPRVEEDSDLAPADPASPPGDELETWTRFHEAVERLPAEEREVFSLAFYHGWTHAQIAELFNVHERTVRRRWVSACRQLAESVRGNLPPPF